VKLLFSPTGWDQYQYWRQSDDDICAKIDLLISEMRRTPFVGLGKPEPLKGDRKGEWSRRINDEHRIVYRVYGKHPEQFLEIVTCRHHYSRK
jgi:toxin YoeB